MDGETIDAKSSDDEDISYEELAQSYQLIYDTWLQTMHMDQKLIKQNTQLSEEKNEFLEKVRSLETKLETDDDIQVELNQIKKLVKMINSGSSKLYHILSLGKVTGDHAGWVALVQDPTIFFFLSKPQIHLTLKKPRNRSRKYPI